MKTYELTGEQVGYLTNMLIDKLMDLNQKHKFEEMEQVGNILLVLDPNALIPGNWMFPDDAY